MAHCLPAAIVPSLPEAKCCRAVGKSAVNVAKSALRRCRYKVQNRATFSLCRSFTHGAPKYIHCTIRCGFELESESESPLKPKTVCSREACKWPSEGK